MRNSRKKKKKTGNGKQGQNIKASNSIFSNFFQSISAKTKIASVLIISTLITLASTDLYSWIKERFKFEKKDTAVVTVSDFRYLRETKKYKVYMLSFKINNADNQIYSLLQVIPYDYLTPRLNLLNNNYCESFGNAVIKSGEIKDFSVNLYLDKRFVLLSKNLQKNYSKNLQLFDNRTGERIERVDEFISFKVAANIVIYGADKKYRKAQTTPVEVRFNNGKETISKIEFNIKPVEFLETNEALHSCSIKADNT